MTLPWIPSICLAMMDSDQGGLDTHGGKKSQGDVNTIRDAHHHVPAMEDKDINPVIHQVSMVQVIIVDIITPTHHQLTGPACIPVQVLTMVGWECREQGQVAC